MTYRIEPDSGVVFGSRGNPIRKMNAGGYLQAQARTHPPFLVHRMIWEWVNGVIPSSLQINHINGCKVDNRICNLELVTPSENTAHAYRLGLSSACGEHNGRSKLSRADVGRSREIVKGGASRKLVAQEFGVHVSTVGDVVTGRRWCSP